MDATDPYLNDTIATDPDGYWTENNQYIQFDLPALTGQVHVWNQTPDEYSGSEPFDMIIGILDKTNNIMVEDQDDGGSPNPDDYSDSEAIAIASDTSGRSSVDTFISFNADDYPGADLAVLVGDLAQSYFNDAFPTDGGAFNVFAVNDVGDASEDVVLAEYGSSTDDLLYLTMKIKIIPQIRFIMYASDQDTNDDITFSLGTDKDEDFLDIDPDTGEVIKVDADETKSSYTFDVIATDDGDGLLSATQEITVGINV